MFLFCPECSHEWNPKLEENENEEVVKEKLVRDAHGNVLNDGDDVSVIKDFKIKGSSSVIKIGTKAKDIRIVDGDHDLDCKVDGIGPMQLKSEFVKKL